MEALNWIKIKLSSRPEKKKLNAVSVASMPAADREEFSDWPQALLAIGTFGSKDLKEELLRHHEFLKDPSSSKDHPDLSLDDINKLQDESLTEQSSIESNLRTDEWETGKMNANFCLNKSLSSSLDSDIYPKAILRDTNNLQYGDDEDLSSDAKIIPHKLKDMLFENQNAIRHRSISFVKKMVIFKSGFTLAPGLGEPLAESRMRKILRAILRKKIYCQSSSPTLAKKQLENLRTDEAQEREETKEIEKDRAKWVKTDSEYIVLEI